MRRSSAVRPGIVGALTSQAMVIGKGSAERNLSPDEVRAIVAEAIESTGVDGKRVLIIIPDGTRTMPMPAMFSLFQ
ncbi:MAG TPA: hypothetical protein VFW94_11160, partial [Candidatus Acidoferrales bacterium]|nr:hypothetical protein [Candidatus Acidoferrales bacterium]